MIFAVLGNTTMLSGVGPAMVWFIAFFAQGIALDVASQVPVISAIVMPGRLAYDDVPLWEILLSLGLNVVAAVLLVRLGARIYDHNLMQTNRKIGFGEALRRRSA